MRSRVILALMLLPLIPGCKDTSSLHLVQDKPETITQLLRQNEFFRARQLIEKHAGAAPGDFESRINSKEHAFVQSTSVKALELEIADELYSAARLLEEALQRVPESRTLRANLDRIEQSRGDRIRINERLQMIVRARYLIDKREYFRQQNSLLAPEMREHDKQLLNDSESGLLATQLREHGEHALESGDLQTAQKCLQLSSELHESSDTRQLLESIMAASDLLEKDVRQASVTGSMEQQKQASEDARQPADRLLTLARQALSDNDLLAARSHLLQMSGPELDTPQAWNLQEQLELAINSRVRLLSSRGDREYRTDDVISAIHTWTTALKLDPENRQLKERLDRAGRVLAKLEQFKELQGK